MDRISYKGLDVAARAIAEDPQLLRKRIDTVNNLGVVGERRSIALVSSTIDSRLVMPDASGQQSLGMKIAGVQGAGKSHTVETCLKIQHTSDYNHISTASEKSLFHSKTSFKNQAIILSEGHSVQKKKDTEFAYGLRILLSEGKATHQVTQKDEKGFRTVRKTVEGPISFVTTTIVESLEKQLESRLMTINSDESAKQTLQILKRTAKISSEGLQEIDEGVCQAWQRFHKNLQPAQVVIPYAEKLLVSINAASILPIGARRSFKRLLSLIKAIAILYQHQRETDTEGRIKADFTHYHMGLQIASEIFEEGIAKNSELDMERIDFLQGRKGQAFEMKFLTQQWGVSKTAVSKWVKRFVKDDFIIWCDQKGNPFATDAALKYAKHAGKAYLKTTKKKRQPTTMLLPTTFELTKDKQWQEGGKLQDLYKLELD